MITIVLNQNASVSVFFLPVKFSFLQACRSQVIVCVMHNFEKNVCSQNVTIYFCKRINTCHFPAFVAKGTSQFMVESYWA